MIYDARSLPNGEVLESEVCIIGAGAAGITLALELARYGISVLVVESGGLEFDAGTQSLYEGEIVGHDFHPLDVARLRYLGGTTNHWNGLCRPLDPIDFEARAWVPDSGWPFDRSDLDPFYRRAHTYCRLGPYAYDDATWVTTDRPTLTFDTDRLQVGHFQSSAVRFGQAYRDDLATASEVAVWLNANVTSIETSESGEVTHLELACLGGPRLKARARFHVLATGAIENARLLLLSDRRRAAGLGNQHGNVGRYFADHPVVRQSGQVMFSRPEPAAPFFHYHRAHGTLTRRFIGLSPEMQRDEELLNCGLNLWPLQPWTSSDGVRSLNALAADLRRGALPDDLLDHLGRIISDFDDVIEAARHRLFDPPPTLFSIDFWSDMPPAADSRVTLSEGRDALGQRRVRLDWRMPEDFRRTFLRMHELLAEELGRSGLGRVQLRADEDDDVIKLAESSFHHMGTTRMHDDPRRGVVDRDCRVHGIPNLFVAGSSTFPTYGHANPTLTIVALAVRLADHLAGRTA